MQHYFVDINRDNVNVFINHMIQIYWCYRLDHVIVYVCSAENVTYAVVT